MTGKYKGRPNYLYMRTVPLPSQIREPLHTIEDLVQRIAMSCARSEDTAHAVVSANAALEFNAGVCGVSSIALLDGCRKSRTRPVLALSLLWILSASGRWCQRGWVGCRSGTELDFGRCWAILGGVCGCPGHVLGRLLVFRAASILPGSGGVWPVSCQAACR